MKAVQYREIGGSPEVVEIDRPSPGPGEVLLKVTAAGLCHSDIAVMGMTREQLGFDLPLTLGHEGVGVVEELGPGADASIEIGEAVAVYGPWGCGRCRNCAEGFENYCLVAVERGIRPPGLGAPGALAQYMIVDSPRHLIPIGDLDPVDAAPLTDAGLTPYHAVRASMDKLGANSTAVVLGVGGLGHVGVQIIKALTGATVIALDVGEEKLAFARELGADHAFESDQSAVDEVRKLTNGYGAEVVFDFVGVQPTNDLGVQMVAMRGDFVAVGIGGGHVKVGFGILPYEAHAYSPYWGTQQDFIDVIELGRRGLVTVHKEVFAIDDAPEAYRRLRDHTLLGRAVVTPNG